MANSLKNITIPLTQKAAIKELLTTDDDINTLSNEYLETIDAIETE